MNVELVYLNVSYKCTFVSVHHLGHFTASAASMKISTGQAVVTYCCTVM